MAKNTTKSALVSPSTKGSSWTASSDMLQITTSKMQLLLRDRQLHWKHCRAAVYSSCVWASSSSSERLHAKLHGVIKYAIKKLASTEDLLTVMLSVAASRIREIIVAYKVCSIAGWTPEAQWYSAAWVCHGWGAAIASIPWMHGVQANFICPTPNGSFHAQEWKDLLPHYKNTIRRLQTLSLKKKCH